MPSVALRGVLGDSAGQSRRQIKCTPLVIERGETLNARRRNKTPRIDTKREPILTRSAVAVSAQKNFLVLERYAVALNWTATFEGQARRTCELLHFVDLINLCHSTEAFKIVL